MDFTNLFELDKWLQAYLILKLVDFITGFIKAYKVEGFKSSKLRTGMVNVMLELVLILFAGVLDQLLALNILLISTKMLFIYKECISIVENADKCGIKIPDVLAKRIQEINPDKKEGEEDGKL